MHFNNLFSFHLYHRCKREHGDTGTHGKSHKAQTRSQTRGMQMSSQDSSHSKVRNSNETYLDLHESSRQPQPINQPLKDSIGNPGDNKVTRRHSGNINASSSRDHEHQNLSQTATNPSNNDELYLHLNISSRQPESMYQGITSPADLINSEMYTELDPNSKSKEAEYQDVTGISHYSDQDSEYQEVLNDTFENSYDKSSRQVPIPPPVEHDETIQNSCGIYVNVKDQ